MYQVREPGGAAPIRRAESSQSSRDLSYAPLRYLRKPVDLVLLPTNEHVLSNPRMRMASQGGTVDWFRFWLQDYEDRDPAKAEQYERWRHFRG
jgi:hypothetical protein